MDIFLWYNFSNMHSQNKVKTIWCPELAYAIGLIVTDGSLSIDGRHINFTSKDRGLVETFMLCLKLNVKVGLKNSGSMQEKKYFNVQFGDISFYRFLQSLGLTTNKSKTLGAIVIPDEYFFHFLRGHFDGDGTFYSYWDPRWRSSFMFYTVFISASKSHILWLQERIRSRIGINGHITKSDKQSCYQLKYAKTESYKLLPQMYVLGDKLCLTRKYLKIKQSLSIIDRSIQ